MPAKHPVRAGLPLSLAKRPEGHQLNVLIRLGGP